MVLEKFGKVWATYKDRGSKKPVTFEGWFWTSLRGSIAFYMVLLVLADMSLWFSSRVSKKSCLEMNMASSYTCYSLVNHLELSLSQSTVIVENLRSPRAFTMRSLSSAEQFKLTNLSSWSCVLVWRIFTIKRLIASRTWLLVTVMLEMHSLRKFMVLAAKLWSTGSSKFTL